MEFMDCLSLLLDKADMDNNLSPLLMYTYAVKCSMNVVIICHLLYTHVL